MSFQSPVPCMFVLHFTLNFEIKWSLHCCSLQLPKSDSLISKQIHGGVFLCLFGGVLSVTHSFQVWYLFPSVLALYARSVVLGVIMCSLLIFQQFFVVGILAVVVVAVTGVSQNEGVRQNALELETSRNRCRMWVGAGWSPGGCACEVRAALTGRGCLLSGLLCGQYSFLAGPPGHPSVTRDTNEDSRMY